MPIINKGIFLGDEVFQRQVGNDWPTAQVITTSDVVEATNLYFTNARVAANVTTLMQSFQGDGIEIEANGRISANVQAAQTVASIGNFTTDDLNEGTANLYFTTARAREAYTAGLGIAISANGVISSKGDDTGLGLFNSGINLAANLKPTTSYANLKIFSSIEGVSFIVFSFLATNKSSNTSYITARVTTESNTVLLANLLKLPPNSSTEIFRKPQLFKSDDSIEIISFDQDKTPAANIVNTYISYQASSDISFKRNVISISDNQAYMLFQSEEVTSIVESLNLVNLGPNVMPVDAYITNNDDELVTYLVSNLIIPPYTSVEICEYPKAILDNDKIWIQKWDNPREMSVFISSKVTSSYAVTPSTAVVDEGDSITFNIETLNIGNGTTLYYTLEEVSGNITQDDFVTPISGEVTVQNDSAVLTLQSNVDASSFTEGPDIFRLQLRKGSTFGPIVSTSSNVTILDTSNTRTIFVSTSGLAAANTSGEGDVLIFNINTTNYPDGTILYYSTNGNVTSSNFVESNVGYVTIVNNANSFSLTSTNIPTNQTRLMDIEIRETDSNGSLLRNTGSIYVYDSAMLYSTATGGTNVYVMTDSETGANYSVHSFAISGTFNVSKVGQVFPEFEYLVVAGGGGGSPARGGGGGAGGFRTGNLTMSTGPYTVTVGSGGTISGNGNPSTFYTITSAGGGHGGTTANVGAPGGSGGGAYIRGQTAGSPGNNPPTIPPQGNPGGSTPGGLTYDGSSGGGGAGAPGGNATPTIQVGPGGAGAPSNITGIEVYYAGGGAGGSSNVPPFPGVGPKPGGIGGGGAGAWGSTVSAIQGNVNLGGGGGGGGFNVNNGAAPAGAAGGSGIVIVRYRTQ